jgi:hypothetical protein
VDGDDGVEPVHLAGEHGAGLELLGVGAERADLALEVGFDRLTLARQVEVGLHVTGAAGQLGVVAELLLQPLAVAHEDLRFGGSAPDGGVGELLLYGAELGTQARGVKDTPAGRARGRARERRRIPDRSASSDLGLT